MSEHATYHPENVSAEPAWLKSPEQDRGPRAAELIEAYAPKPGEKVLYDQLLEKAADGTLGFDPVENLLEFAKVADLADEEGREGGVIEIPNETGADLGKIPKTLALRLIQQVRLARSLGYRIEGDPYAEDGKLKLKFSLPRDEGAVAKVRFRADKTPIYGEPTVDAYGDTIPAEVAGALVAGRYFEKDAETHLGQKLSKEAARGARSIQVKMQLIDFDYNRRASMDIYAAYKGSGTLVYNQIIAEAMGYQTGRVTRDEEGFEPVNCLPLIGVRPGFEHNKLPPKGNPVH